MKFLKAAPFLAALLLASACKLNPPETDTFYNIPEEVNLELATLRDSATGKADLAVRFTTAKLYPCKNVAVDAEADWQPSDLLIVLNKIVQPANCTAGNAPASTTLSLGDRPEASYRCRLSLAGAVEINGSLEILADETRIIFEERAGVVVQRPLLRRVPLATAWGLVSYPKGGDAATAKQFLAELADLTTAPALDEGYYGDFDWQSANVFEVLLPAPDGKESLDFVRSFEGVPRQKLEALAKKYRDDAAHPLSILFWTGTGRI